jgi:hypothetical protein
VIGNAWQVIVSAVMVLFTIVVATVELSVSRARNRRR